ncbi:hypothetical protein MUK42_30093 [Musa troglodytarum]|uniref:Uncharacterized protein n=1 Tax=Musa troglodytarum TaxID=320322 RepID=A0A9E7K3Q5_9LILI|nr:hypothetical protein MUK42_30093 [Musa troglodytarum]
MGWTQQFSPSSLYGCRPTLEMDAHGIKALAMKMDYTETISHLEVEIDDLDIVWNSMLKFIASLVIIWGEEFCDPIQQIDAFVLDWIDLNHTTIADPDPIAILQ